MRFWTFEDTASRSSGTEEVLLRPHPGIQDFLVFDAQKFATALPAGGGELRITHQTRNGFHAKLFKIGAMRAVSIFVAHLAHLCASSLFSCVKLRCARNGLRIWLRNLFWLAHPNGSRESPNPFKATGELTSFHRSILLIQRVAFALKPPSALGSALA